MQSQVEKARSTRGFLELTAQDGTELFVEKILPAHFPQPASLLKFRGVSHRPSAFLHGPIDLRRRFDPHIDLLAHVKICFG